MQLRRLRDLREDNDDIQAKVASLLCVSQNTYSAYERGRRGIPLNALITLADYYKTSIDYLVGRTNRREFEKQFRGNNR